MNFDDNQIWDKILENIAEKLREAENYGDDNSRFVAAQSTSDERQLAHQLLDTLVEQYKNKSLEQVFDGEITTNKEGSFFKITYSEPLNLQLLDRELAQEKLVNDLKLVFGIKHAREKQLKSQGYKTLYHLLDHPQYGRQAGRVVQTLETHDISRIQDLIRQRYGSWSAETAFYLSAFFDPEDFLFFDIETMGLFHRAIILFGYAYIEGQNLIVEQLLLTGYDDEPAALYHFIRQTERFKALVSFNGRAFDYNYINQRLIYNFLQPLPQMVHFDMLHFARKKWEFLPSRDLKTLERHILDIQRNEDVPSDMVPEFYMKYLETGNPGPLIPIVTHNRQDLVSLVKLFGELHRQIPLNE